MSASYYIKHQMSCLPDVHFQVDIDRGRKLVIVRTDAFDSALVAELLVQILPSQEGVVAFPDDNDTLDLGGTWMTKPSPFAAYIEFAGQRHRLEIVRPFAASEAQVVTAALRDPQPMESL